MAYEELKNAARMLKAMHGDGLDVVAAHHPDDQPDDELRQAMDQVGARLVADPCQDRGNLTVGPADSFG